MELYRACDEYSDASLQAHVALRRAVTYLIAPAMTSWVTWRWNTRVVVIVILVRINDYEDDDDKSAAAVIVGIGLHCGS